MKNTIKKPHKIKYFLPPIFTRSLNSLKSFYEYLPYRKLLSKNNYFKDLHVGKRCFILGSGPSVNDFNLKYLNDEIVIGLNSFYIHPDFDEIFSENEKKYMLCAPFHGPDDKLPESHWKKLLEEHQSSLPLHVTLFYGLGVYQPSAKLIIEKNNLLNNFDVNYYFTSITQDEWYNPVKKHFDFTKNLITASTSSVWGLMLAVHMGFDEIYLIGVDNNNISLPRDNPRFIKGGIGHLNEKEITEFGTFSWNYFTSYHLSRTLKQYEYINLIANGNTKIFNCSKRSMADMFKWVDYYSIFNK